MFRGKISLSSSGLKSKPNNKSEQRSQVDGFLLG
jgi:hypothetical protein